MTEISAFTMLLLGLVFSTSAISKLAGMRRFEAAVERYRILPRRIVPFFARGLPALELLTACTCIAGSTVIGGSLSLGLLAAFTAAIAWNLAHGRRRIDCGCLGSSRDGISWWLVARNAALASLSIVAVLASNGLEPIWTEVSIRVLGWAQIALIALAGYLAFLTITSVAAMIPISERSTQSG